jgi:hypothetical protein
VWGYLGALHCWGLLGSCLGCRTWQVSAPTQSLPTNLVQREGGGGGSFHDPCIALRQRWSLHRASWSSSG